MKAGQAGSRQGLPWTSRRPSDIYVMLVCWLESMGYLMMLHLDDASKYSVLYSSYFLLVMAFSYSLITVSLICNSPSWFLNEGLK